MRRTKQEKGITLIALIITIVVLLILAVIAINSIQNDGIISHAGNTANTYNEAVKNEQQHLQNYLDYLDKVNGGSVPEKVGDATVGIKATELSTINGQTYSANNPPIPAGFMPIDTSTSSWDATDLAAEVKKGLVISDGTSEFVWIPVENINKMAKATTGKDANGRTNYQGILYDFGVADDGTLTATEKTNTAYREPKNNLVEPDEEELMYYGDSRDKASRFTTIQWNENYYQESFNKMVESVAKYKGFYVGRYEMTYNSTTNKAESKLISNFVGSGNWWQIYEQAITLSSTVVSSEMVWGCQYDAMMLWMQSNSIDVTSKTPMDTSRGVVATYNDLYVNGGGTNSNDLLNNVYDLMGGLPEWTQATASEWRSYRGGGFDWSGESPAYRSNCHAECPSLKATHLTTRLTLCLT